MCDDAGVVDALLLSMLLSLPHVLFMCVADAFVKYVMCGTHTTAPL